MKKILQELYIIFDRPTAHKYGRGVQYFIFANIFVSILIMFLETDQSLKSYISIFEKITFITSIIFSIEYILCVISYPHHKIKFIFSTFMLIDLAILLLFSLSFFIDINSLIFLRMLRYFVFSSFLG